MQRICVIVRGWFHASPSQTFSQVASQQSWWVHIHLISLICPSSPDQQKIEPKNQPLCSKEKTPSSKITLCLSSHASFPGFIIWPTQTNCTTTPPNHQQHLYQAWFPQKNGSLVSMIPAFFQEENSPHDFHHWRSSWALTGSHEPRCDRNCCDQQRSSRNGPTAFQPRVVAKNCGVKEKQGWKSREYLKEMKVAYIQYNIIFCIIYTYSYSYIYIHIRMYVCVCIVSGNHV